MLKTIFKKLRLYWTLSKSLQTGLLLATGIAGFLSAATPRQLGQLPTFAITLYFAISGSTLLNMWHDRDIDQRMPRTSFRPLPAGLLPPTEVLIIGLSVSAIGMAGAFMLDFWLGAVVLAGWFFDVVIYTLWLKRRTCWAIIFGGLSGGMPILAGRVLATGGMDWIGQLLAASILFWIPTHIMTFSIRYLGDYRAANLPTFPDRYGINFTRMAIALSSALASISILTAALALGLQSGFLRLLIVLSFGLFSLAIGCVIRPSDQVTGGLFKYASLFMLAAMVLLIL